MSRREKSDIPWGAIVLGLLLLYVAYGVVNDPDWQVWIDLHCGWLCQ